MKPLCALEVTAWESASRSSHSPFVRQSLVVKRVPVVAHGGREQAAERVEIVLDRTPLYAESGGQIADAGWISGTGGAATNGQGRILDIEPAKLHERVAVFMGSKNEVERVTAYHG